MGLPTIDELDCTVTDTLAMARKLSWSKASLDALCNRLGVDRSKRVLHGALIDCELLAEVYLAMTRGQYSLVDSLTAETEEQRSAQTLSRPQHLKVIAATEQELDEHKAYLDVLDNAVGGVCAWRADV